jgi:hypothetical protein
MVDQCIGQLIQRAEGGDGTAADQLFGALYQELHRIAERQLQGAARDEPADTPEESLP